MSSEWLRIGPETAYWVPRIAAKLWNNIDIYISENGTSSEDKIASDGNIYDLDRIMFLRNYLTSCSARLRKVPRSAAISSGA
jgi:beta-glucosidase